MAETRSCLDCGFLTIEGHELSLPQRTMLASHKGGRGGSAVMPSHPEGTRCFKNLWDYDLHYVEDSFDGVLEELSRPREACRGFLQYSAGRTPAEHLEQEVEDRKGKLQWRVAKLGFWGALLGAALGTLLAGLVQWLLKVVGS